MKKVLCITLNPALDMTIAVDGLKIGEVNRATSTQLDAAGKALNSAQVLADLGVDCVASGFLGQQNQASFVQLFADRCTPAAIEDHFVRVDGNTRTNIKLVDHGTTTDVNGKGFWVTDADKTKLLQKAGQLAAACDAVLIAGSLPQGFGMDDFHQLINVVMAVNPKLAVDVSGEALKAAMSYPLWLIKPNSDELTEAFGMACQTADEQRALLTSVGASIEHVVISMGEKGVHWYAPHAAYHATPPKVTVKSTVGAGDTLVAAMIQGLLNADEDAQVLTQAVALSAHAVSIVGFGVADPERLATLMAQVQINRI